MNPDELRALIHTVAPLLPEAQKQELVRQIQQRVVAPAEARELALRNAGQRTLDTIGMGVDENQVGHEWKRELTQALALPLDASALRQVEGRAKEMGREEAAQVAERREQEHTRLYEHYDLQKGGALTAAKHFSQAATARSIVQAIRAGEGRTHVHS